MSEWLDPSGHANYGIGLCDRCHQKFPLDELYRDPNSPGLRVCLADLDVYDPYRLPARQTENITLPFTRPDSPLDDGTANLGDAIATNTPFTIIITSGGAAIAVSGEPPQ
jgi:hypothetical protein